MAEECMKLAGSLGLDVTVFDEKAMEKLGMGCLLGVAKGSHQKPRMVVIEYHGGKKDDTPVALVGKGLTFDSGGISLKPAKGMDEMKYDMCGAAAMIASIATAAAMKLPSALQKICPEVPQLNRETFSRAMPARPLKF